jgi:hypothetical protein
LKPKIARRVTPMMVGTRPAKIAARPIGAIMSHDR